MFAVEGRGVGEEGYEEGYFYENHISFIPMIMYTMKAIFR
jgi:hypothetical protein